MYSLPDLGIWRKANEYQEAAALLDKHEMGCVAAINAALAIEIYLKSFLSTEVKSSWEDGTIYQRASECEHGHDLIKLYEKIQKPYQTLLINEFANLYPDTEFPDLLEKYKDVFFRARYRFEPNSRGNLDNGIVYLANEFKEVVLKVKEHTDPTYHKRDKA